MTIIQQEEKATTFTTQQNRTEHSDEEYSPIFVLNSFPQSQKTIDNIAKYQEEDSYNAIWI